MKNTFLVITCVVAAGLFAALVTFHPNQIPRSLLGATTTNSQTSNCPAGFIRVPRNALYHISDFCVMKYDAKCAAITNPTVGLQPTSGTSCSGGMAGISEGVYKNSGAGCACAGNKKVVSTASGFPITFIPEFDTTVNNSKNYCQMNGWHLITNAEWMTIARNAETVPANWCNRDGSQCGFAPGTSNTILANGHNDNAGESSASASTHGALIAAPDDQPCFGTTTDGSNTCGGKSSQKRTLTLTNGAVIWDFAGNVWQWVDAEVAQKDQPQSQTGGKQDFGWKWSEFSQGTKERPSAIIDNGQSLVLGYDAFRPSNSSWNSTNGVGRVYHFSGTTTNTTQFTFIRGGNWRHGDDSGAFTIHMSPTDHTHNIDDVGFRCVSDVMVK